MKHQEIILDIINHSKSHPNASEVYNEARLISNKIAVGTVYRNLNKLLEQKRIRRISLPNRADAYDNIRHDHNHFLCLQCGVLIDIPPLPKEAIQSLELPEKVLVIHHDMLIQGLCHACQEAENRDNS